MQGVFLFCASNLLVIVHIGALKPEAGRTVITPLRGAVITPLRCVCDLWVITRATLHSKTEVRMAFPIARPQPDGDSSARDAKRAGGTPLVSRIPPVRDGVITGTRSAVITARESGPSAAAASALLRADARAEGEELAPAEALDCRTLIDECVKHADWIRLFLRLLGSESVPAAALLVRLRFVLPHPNAVVKDQPMSIRSRLGLWDDEDDDLETPPGTAEEIS
jgi:hypothetical protein